MGAQERINFKSGVGILQGTKTGEGIETDKMYKRESETLDLMKGSP